MTGENLFRVPATVLQPELGLLKALTDEQNRQREDSSLTRAELESLVKQFPTSSLLWARLSDAAFTAGEIVASYAYARVGYHRGLDALRKAGWRGQGPVPWSHEANRGVLRSFYALRRAAEKIGENDEVMRLTELLNSSDPIAIKAISIEPTRRREERR